MNDPAIWQFSLAAMHALIWGASLLVALLLFLRFSTPRGLAVLTLIMTVALVMLGAYVRLSDAGLGCPDWPGCYGQLSPTYAAEQIQAAQSAAPNGGVSLPKAWREMVHRYFASLVGVMVLAIAIKALRDRRTRLRDPDDPAGKYGLPIALVIAVVAQGLFGKWTVTLLLKPAIVSLHLLGGMTLVALLAWLCARHLRLTGGPPSSLRSLRPLATIGLVVLSVQIALGGWVSTNYAALACMDFPTCHGAWKPATDFSHGFHFVRELGMTTNGEPLSNEALNAIHWAHRIGALVTTVVLIAAAVALLRAHPALRRQAMWIKTALVLQILIGISTVHFAKPIFLATAHNFVAAVLLATLMVAAYRVSGPKSNAGFAVSTTLRMQK